ncbi:MAG: arsenate reductase [Myxococcota bacterium]|jgi:arsenate reductase
MSTSSANTATSSANTAAWVLYQYPGCDTCRKARKWLDARGVAYTAIHIVDAPPTADQLRTLWQRSGLPLKKLFNTAGQSYRNGGFKDRLPKLSESEALDALAADGKLIKRPLFDAGKHVFVGFRETEWAEVIPPEAKTL